MEQNNLPDRIRVLLVDDDEEDYLIIKHLFASVKAINAELEWVDSSDKAIELIEQGAHDAYLIDYRIDARTGFDILNEIKAIDRPQPFILLTGIEDEGIERESIRKAASDYLVKKNLTAASLAKALYYALGRKEQEHQKINNLIEINKTKDEFISIASHQLRTPATTVKQYVAMVIDGLGGELSDKQKTLLSKAYESNERQLTIINNLLKVAQIDSGTVDLARIRTDISQLVSEAVEDFILMFEQNGQKLKYDAEAGAYSDVDENAIRMIIDNLLENALKYSETGAKTIVTVRKNQDQIMVKVADEGVGVSNPERLFKKFSRIENKLSTEVGGTGIGLYWAQSMAWLHGGNLFFKPNEKMGSQFILSLPSVK